MREKVVATNFGALERRWQSAPTPLSHDGDTVICRFSGRYALHKIERRRKYLPGDKHSIKSQPIE